MKIIGWRIELGNDDLDILVDSENDIILQFNSEEIILSVEDAREIIKTLSLAIKNSRSN